MRWRTTAFAATALGFVLVATVGLVPRALADDNPFARGPDPSTASVEALRGPFATSQTVVSRVSVSGFGGGTIYFPTSTAEGTFGAVAIAPGFTARQSSIAWLGPRLASQGFVIFTIDTITTSDQPSSRARQLLAALDFLVLSSSARSRIDPGRLGVMGHSMGGGGTLEAAISRPQLQAAIPLTPWDLTKSFSGMRVPTLVIGAESDSIAPVRSHAEPFFGSLPSALDKAYLELNNASHFAPNTDNTTIAKFSISWLKRFVDNDIRYEQFLCPPPSVSSVISEYRDSCPHS